MCDGPEPGEVRDGVEATSATSGSLCMGHWDCELAAPVLWLHHHAVLCVLWPTDSDGRVGRAAWRAGEMSDAAEVMGAIYDSLRTISGGGELVDSVFGLHVAERVHCAACGKDTHANAYTQFFHNVSATALRMQARSACSRGSGVPHACWHIAAPTLPDVDAVLHALLMLTECKGATDCDAWLLQPCARWPASCRQ